MIITYATVFVTLWIKNVYSRIGASGPIRQQQSILADSAHVPKMQQLISDYFNKVNVEREDERTRGSDSATDDEHRQGHTDR